MKKPPRLLYVNPTGTETQAGQGLIGFTEIRIAAQDILHDQAEGIKVKKPYEMWVYELKEVKHIAVGLS